MCHLRGEGDHAPSVVWRTAGGVARQGHDDARRSLGSPAGGNSDEWTRPVSSPRRAGRVHAGAVTPRQGTLLSDPPIEGCSRPSRPVSRIPEMCEPPACDTRGVRSSRRGIAETASSGGQGGLPPGVDSTYHDVLASVASPGGISPDAAGGTSANALSEHDDARRGLGLASRHRRRKGAATEQRANPPHLSAPPTRGSGRRGAKDRVSCPRRPGSLSGR